MEAAGRSMGCPACGCHSSANGGSCERRPARHGARPRPRRARAAPRARLHVHNKPPNELARVRLREPAHEQLVQLHLRPPGAFKTPPHTRAAARPQRRDGRRTLAPENGSSPGSDAASLSRGSNCSVKFRVDIAQASAHPGRGERGERRHCAQGSKSISKCLCGRSNLCARESVRSGRRLSQARAWRRRLRRVMRQVMVVVVVAAAAGHPRGASSR